MKTITIQVPQKPGVVTFAVVDDDLHVALDQFAWRLNPEGYAVRYDSHGRTIRMHREVAGAIFDDGFEVDHKDGNRLNNQLANLRACEHRQNQQNRRGANRASTSLHRGVSLCRQTGRWKATVTLDGRQHWLGRHDTERGAARAAAAFRAAHMPFSAEASNNNTKEKA